MTYMVFSLSRLVKLEFYYLNLETGKENKLQLRTLQHCVKQKGDQMQSKTSLKFK